MKNWNKAVAMPNKVPSTAACRNSWHNSDWTATPVVPTPVAVVQDEPGVEHSGRRLARRPCRGRTSGVGLVERKRQQPHEQPEKDRMRIRILIGVSYPLMMEAEAGTRAKKSEVEFTIENDQGGGGIGG